MDVSVNATSLVGATGENFTRYMRDLNQATNGEQSIPYGYEVSTVKSIIASKENQDIYDQTFARNEYLSDKMSKMNRTENLDIYNETGIKAINKGKGKNIDITA